MSLRWLWSWLGSWLGENRFTAYACKCNASFKHAWFTFNGEQVAIFDSLVNGLVALHKVKERYGMRDHEELALRRALDGLDLPMVPAKPAPARSRETGRRRDPVSAMLEDLFGSGSRSNPRQGIEDAIAGLLSNLGLHPPPGMHGGFGPGFGGSPSLNPVGTSSASTRMTRRRACSLWWRTCRTPWPRTSATTSPSTASTPAPATAAPSSTTP